MAKVEEYRGLSTEELRARLNDAEEELANLKFQLGSQQLDNKVKVRLARRDVARIKTIVRERELGLGKGSGEAKEAS